MTGPTVRDQGVIPNQLANIGARLFFASIVSLDGWLHVLGVRYTLLLSITFGLTYERSFPKKTYGDCADTRP